MDYRKTAQEIYDHIGKKENIISAAHCATRLRLVISDNSKADKEYVENIEGVKGVFFAQGQMQIILGTGIVNKVYDEFIRIAGVSESSKEELKKVAASRANPVPQSFVPARSSTSWKTTSAAFTAVRSAIWISPEIWTPASQSGLRLRKTEKCSSAPVLAL